MEYKLSTRDYETEEPRIALTANSDRGYTVSASAEDSASSRYAWKAFNNILPANSSTDFWFSGSSRGAYTGGSSGREYVGSSNLGTDSGRTATVDGEWIQVQLPYKIQLTTFNIYGQPNTINNFPASGVLYARNETTEDWTSIYVYNDVTISTNHTQATHTPTTSTFYNTYALSITKKSDSAGGVSVGELELFGTPFTANVATGTDVVLHTTPNVPKTDFSNVYYDGQDYTSMPATVADKSGNGVTGTPSGGVGFDTTYKAFTFDGVDDKITATLTNPAGAWVHSASMWFKVNSLSVNRTIYSINNDTTGEANRTPHLLISTNGSLRHAFYGQDSQFGATGTIVPNKWYHISATYSGGATATSRKVFLNGTELAELYFNPGATSGSLDAHANAILKIGDLPEGGFPFNGSIANFRLYNQALSADEIWELYAYQKEYFGVSPDVVTLKAGRVGIGTSEPRAVLDVRGGLDVTGSFQCGNSPLRFYVLRGVHPSSATVVTVPFTEHKKRGAELVSFTGSTTTSSGSVVPWNYHDETNQYEIMVYYNNAAGYFTFFGQGTSTFGLPWRMYVVTT
jgi:hypothetical protein